MKGLRLDHDSDLPLHAQVERLLRELIQRPEFKDGGLLPDEVTLAHRLGISRGTLRAGLTKLVYDGVLERKAGVGTRVATRHLQSGIGAWRSFTREMEKQGIRVETYQLDARETTATPEAALALQLKSGGTALRLDRLRGWGRQPVVHSRSWLHPRLKLRGKEDFRRPLYEVIERSSGAVADHAREEFLAVTANATMAACFKVRKGTPLLLRCHTVYDPGGRPIEYAEVHYLSDRFTLTLDIRRETP